MSVVVLAFEPSAKLIILWLLVPILSSGSAQNDMDRSIGAPSAAGPKLYSGNPI